jgi:hypothetical protein
MNGPTERQAHALANPITDPSTTDIDLYLRIDPQPDGNLLVSVLAVDR